MRSPREQSRFDGWIIEKSQSRYQFYCRAEERSPIAAQRTADLPRSPKHDDTDGFMGRKILHHLVQGRVAVRSKKSIRIGRSVKQGSSYVVQILQGENKWGTQIQYKNAWISILLYGTRLTSTWSIPRICEVKISPAARHAARATCERRFFICRPRSRPIVPAAQTSKPSGCCFEIWDRAFRPFIVTSLKYRI